MCIVQVIRVNQNGFCSIYFKNLNSLTPWSHQLNGGAWKSERQASEICWEPLPPATLGVKVVPTVIKTKVAWRGQEALRSWGWLRYLLQVSLEFSSGLGGKKMRGTHLEKVINNPRVSKLFHSALKINSTSQGDPTPPPLFLLSHSQLINASFMECDTADLWF